MTDKASNNPGGLVLFFFTIVIALLAWITYGTLEGVLGMLSFVIIGVLNIFPWIIPFVGIPLGILDILGIYSFALYDTTLSISRLKSSWLTILWYWNRPRRRCNHCLRMGLQQRWNNR